jgi:hypothetical protein
MRRARDEIGERLSSSSQNSRLADDEGANSQCKTRDQELKDPLDTAMNAANKAKDAGGTDGKQNDPAHAGAPVDEGWAQVRRADWREDAALALECPAFLQPVKAARLEAIGTLRNEAASSVQRSLPQTKQALELCLWSAFSQYAETVFDKIAEVRLKLEIRANARKPTNGG